MRLLVIVTTRESTINDAISLVPHEDKIFVLREFFSVKPSDVDQLCGEIVSEVLKRTTPRDEIHFIIQAPIVYAVSLVQILRHCGSRFIYFQQFDMGSKEYIEYPLVPY